MNKNKILLLSALFCLIVFFVVELTSPTSLYRDPYMFQHFSAAEFILEKNKVSVNTENLGKYDFFGWQFLYNEKTTDFFLFGQRFSNNKNLIFFPIPVLSGVIFSLLSGLDIYFLFNHFYFLLFIVFLSFFVLFNKLFKDSKLAFGLSLIVVLFPFEPLYYKITIHGWFFVRIFSAMALYFLVRLLKTNFSFKSKNLFFLLFFSFLGVYSDKSAFALVLFPVILFFVVYFFFQRKKNNVRKRFLNFFVLGFLFLLVLSFFNIFNQISWNIDAFVYNLSNLNFIPSFLFPQLPFSEFYLQKSFAYKILRYFIPFFVVLSLLIFNFTKIKDFLSKNVFAKTFVVSQAIFYFVLGFGMLFSFAFISSRGASMIFLFLSLVCFIGLNQLKKPLRYFLFFVFFVCVFVVPMLFFTQTPQYKYEQFNEKHLASIEWIKSDLNKDSRIYSDVKMAKSIAFKTNFSVASPRLEFGEFMEEEIIPIYFDSNISGALSRLKQYNATHLVLTKEMSLFAVQPANELMKPATHLKKFDDSEFFDKIFENQQTRIYKIN